MRFLRAFLWFMAGAAIALTLGVQLVALAPRQWKEAPSTWTANDRTLVEAKYPGGFWRNDQYWKCESIRFGEESWDVWAVRYGNHNEVIDSQSRCWR